MPKLSDNYYNRKYYLEKDEVPNFGVIKKTMKSPLAKVYFKTMAKHERIMVGLESPLKGGTGEMYMPPEDLLQGRAVLKPIKKEDLDKLGYKGIEYFSNRILQNHSKELETFKINAIEESDKKGQERFNQYIQEVWDETSKAEAERVSQDMNQSIQEFAVMYGTSMNNLEQIILDAAITQVEAIKTDIHANMAKRYEYLVKEQAKRLYKKYEDLLEKTKQKLKDEFTEQVQIERSKMCKKFHDINVEKHTAIEKIRNLLEVRNLACQVYIALKEREECYKELQVTKREHSKIIKAFKETIAMQDYDICLEKEKMKKRIEFNKIWKTKVCQVVKKFQKFVQYCLMDLPELAEFFINMEKIMLLQLGEAVENPCVCSNFEEEPHKWPTPPPHPYRLFCDKGHTQEIDSHLCPKHCTSSSSQFPAIIINNKCMYAACDNFTQFTDTIKKYISGQLGENADFDDEHLHKYDIRVNQSPSNKILELKLESSLMQVVQKELVNVRELPIVCETCKSTFCFCSPLPPSTVSIAQEKTMICTCFTGSLPTSETKLSRSAELNYEREPQIESYLDFVKTLKCSCSKTAKKHLREHLPPYMIKTSEFEEFKLPFYEPCSVETLQKFVRDAKQVSQQKRAERIIMESINKNDKSTQYEDLDYSALCECMSEDEMVKLFRALHKEYQGSQKPSAKAVDAALIPTYLTESVNSFATKRAHSLRRMITDSDLLDVFMKDDCNSMISAFY